MSEGFIKRFADAVGKSNEMQSQLELQISLHAYSKIMSQRLYDMIPMLARQSLVLKPHKEFSSLMHSACSDDTLLSVMAEDSMKKKKRLRLEERIQCFEQSRKMLSSLN